MKWLLQLSDKLTRTRETFFGRVADLFRKGDVSNFFWEELEELLLEADTGVLVSQQLLSKLRQAAKEKHVKNSRELFEVFRQEVVCLLGSNPAGIRWAEKGPTVILTVGVNGSGKTTTLGKLAFRFKAEGKKVLLAAADTFRAAAIDQLEVWSNRAGVELVKHRQGSDPASVAFDAVQSGNARHFDLILIDTAGRLQTKFNLMEELKKIKRVIQKGIPTAPHETLLILDAVTGQNALSQAKLFKEAVDISGIVLTKLDGSAKGGFVLAIGRELQIPVKFAGIGEAVEDLAPFDPVLFAEALLEGKGQAKLS